MQLANTPPKQHERATERGSTALIRALFTREPADDCSPARCVQNACRLVSRRGGFEKLFRASRPSPRPRKRIRPLFETGHPFARPFLGPRVSESRVQLLARPRARRSEHATEMPAIDDSHEWNETKYPRFFGQSSMNRASPFGGENDGRTRFTTRTIASRPRRLVHRALSSRCCELGASLCHPFVARLFSIRDPRRKPHSSRPFVRGSRFLRLRRTASVEFPA